MSSKTSSTFTKPRDSREMALKFLFCQEFSSEEEQQLSLRSRITSFQTSFKAPEDVWKFTWDLLNNYEQNGKEIDQKIQSHLINWNLDRISLTDKSILRIALAEMLYMDTPPKVAINEAIDLGKKYSTADSSSFINGILDKVLSECA